MDTVCHLMLIETNDNVVPIESVVVWGWKRLPKNEIMCDLNSIFP